MHRTPQFTPMDLSSPYYAILFNGLQLGGVSLGFSAGDDGSVVVDMGTSNLVLQVLPPAGVREAPVVL